ncbi:MarR family transcriptional regulator [Listeria weihenstephanensis FSL R9-0317]|uniref:MarR family transcriptional regulator n=1 Tax=Listeria weihenstephanensis TaxID=1006155 RepID=A0A1S7FXD3_9LIST|nr:helix-turn-helix domain-containing protein [Listeria weihenstephanensis]AQY52059.1 MarR family transcriptional regulator [Listeria weihenstephanensis]EUJ38739.1 MarR family transcriptional regulator [Listeria weihenstephanensis FSL R9-0317]MBC1501665.1 MarR family transcriptional regulator [Listeria weihenstephanensis]
MDKDDRLNQQIALFYFAYKTFVETADRLIGKYDITRTHHRILFFVAHSPGIKMNELLTLLEVTKQALHQPLLELKEKGYISLEPSALDKRVRCVFLTETGTAIESELGEAQRRHMAAALADSGDPDGKVWTHVLEQYARERPGFALFK